MPRTQRSFEVAVCYLKAKLLSLSSLITIASHDMTTETMIKPLRRVGTQLSHYVARPTYCASPTAPQQGLPC
jgi:hypothetical protein